MAKIKIDKDRCKGCGLCIIYCPVKKLAFSPALNKRGVHYAEGKSGITCIGCGRCYLICPDACIEVYEETKPAKKK